MAKKSNALGVFDSGVGGLTVVKALMDQLPLESVYYFADTLNLPYGNKSGVEIERLCTESMSFLATQPVKALIIACNTASAYAYESLKKRFNIPIFDVISPSVEEAVKRTKSNKIAVLATESTIESDVYEKLIKNRLPDADVMSIPCPLLVSIVEENMFSHHLARILVRQYIAPIKNTGIDTVILGCTHYPLVLKLFKEELGDKIELVDSSQCSVKNIKEYLKENKLLATTKSSSGNFYFVSGCPESFNKTSSAVLKQKVNSVKKELEKGEKC